MFDNPDDLVVGHDGFWLAVDDDSRGVCGSTVTFLGRTATRAVPVSAPGCVFGPKRVEGEAEAIWATSKTFSHPMQVVFAKGPPPNGLTTLPRKVVGTFDVVVHASDGVYWALDGGEVIRRRADGVEERVAPPIYSMPTPMPRAIAVHGDNVYLAMSTSLSGLDLFRIPRAGGDRVPMGSFAIQTMAAHLLASDSGVVLHLLPRNDAGERLLLIDPTGRCPQVELPIPDYRRQTVVDRDVVYIPKEEGLIAVSFANRADAGAATPSH